MGEVRDVEEWVLERGLGGHYDGRYRVNDLSVAGCCVSCGVGL